MSDPIGYNGSFIDEERFFTRNNLTNQEDYVPMQGSMVIAFLRNGVQVEGEVLQWTERKSVLKSLTGASIIVIQKTSDDVIFYKISNAKNEFERVKNKPHKNEEDIKQLAQLKNDLNDLERAEIRERLNTHTPSGIVGNRYGTLPNIPIKVPVEHPSEKAPREDPGISAELQNMFSKKR